MTDEVSNKPNPGFTPGSMVRVRGQIMGVGTASLRGLLGEAEPLHEVAKSDIIAAREGVASDDLNPQSALTDEQKAEQDLADEKAKREFVIRRGDTPASVDAEQAEAESRLGDASKPAVEPGTISDGEPPKPTDEDETEREDQPKADPEGEPSDLQEQVEKDPEAAALGETEAQAEDRREQSGDVKPETTEAEKADEVKADVEAGQPADAEVKDIQPEQPRDLKVEAVPGKDATEPAQRRAPVADAPKTDRMAAARAAKAAKRAQADGEGK